MYDWVEYTLDWIHRAISINSGQSDETFILSILISLTFSSKNTANGECAAHTSRKR
jgi:hypothetical protein